MLTLEMLTLRMRAAELKTENGKNFVKGLHNARSLLDTLERSFEKTSKYEDRLLRCRAAHHAMYTCGSDGSITDPDSNFHKETPQFSQTRSSTSSTPWSAESVAGLQHQYKELSMHYEALLRAFHEHCTRDALHTRLRQTRAELARVNKSLLIIGEKFMNLKYKRLSQKIWYEERIYRLKLAARASLRTAERARRALDDQLACRLAIEQDTAMTLLLERIRKCNQLFLENLRLKSRVDEMI